MGLTDKGRTQPWNPAAVPRNRVTTLREGSWCLTRGPVQTTHGAYEVEQPGTEEETLNRTHEFEAFRPKMFEKGVRMAVPAVEELVPRKQVFDTKSGPSSNR